MLTPKIFSYNRKLFNILTEATVWLLFSSRIHNRVYSRTHRISDPPLKCITILMAAVMRMVIMMTVLFMVIALGCNPTGSCATCSSAVAARRRLRAVPERRWGTGIEVKTALCA